MSKSEVNTRPTHTRSSSSQLSVKSAWARGPPKPSTPVLSTFTDAPSTPTHSRRASSFVAPLFSATPPTPTQPPSVIKVGSEEAAPPPRPPRSSRRKSSAVLSASPIPVSDVLSTVSPNTFQTPPLSIPETKRNLAATAPISIPKRRSASIISIPTESLDSAQNGTLSSENSFLPPSNSKPDIPPRRRWESISPDLRRKPSVSSKAEENVEEETQAEEADSLLELEDAEDIETRRMLEEDAIHEEMLQQEEDKNLELERQAQWLKAEETRIQAIQEQAEVDRLQYQIVKDVEVLQDGRTAKIRSQESRRRPIPGMLDLSSLSNTMTVKAQTSAIWTAKAIVDINGIKYPPGVRSPKPELNAGIKSGQFRYDRDFLLQFMKVCVDKPDLLPDLGSLGIEETAQTPSTPRGKRRRSSVRVPPTPLIIPPLTPGGASGKSAGNRTPSAGARTPSGTVPSTPGIGGKTSDDRFAAATAALNRTRTTSGQKRPTTILPLPIPVSRSTSQGSARPPPSPMDPKGDVKRTRSLRGRNRSNSTKAPPLPAGAGSLPNGGLADALPPVTPLEFSADRWIAKRATNSKRNKAEEDLESTEVLERKTKALLNKLTMEKFDSISDQLLQLANRSQNEPDGRSITQVIKHIFEKATDEAAWSHMYARLCRKMMELISPEIRDESIKNTEGKPLSGGQLFRTYLLSRCQTDFERGWSTKETSASSASDKDEDAKPAAGEEALYSEEYYAAQKIKRRGLGLVIFIGELFKLQMLTERIMHKCIQKLLSNPTPEEEEIESLCKLLVTVGQPLSAGAGKDHMDKYFARIQELSTSSTASQRMQFMLLDLIELRSRNWMARSEIPVPSTIAAKQDASKPPPPPRRDSRRKSVSTTDGWSNVAAPQSVTRSSSKSNTRDPKGSVERPTHQSRPSVQNMYAILNRTPSETGLSNPASGHSRSASTSRGPSRKPSGDFGSSGEPLLARKKLNLLPRSVPLAAEVPSVPPLPKATDDGAAAKAVSLAKTGEDVKEFFAVRDLAEGEAYFSSLPPEHHHILVDKLVSKVIDAKEADVQLVTTLFGRLVANSGCSKEQFEEGLSPTVELLEDISVDVPTAYAVMGRLLHAARLDLDDIKKLGAKIVTEADAGSDTTPTGRLLKAYNSLGE